MTLVGARNTRVLMASLALLCLACQASTLAHLMLVAHAACAEHGELIDARTDAAPLPIQRPPENGAALAAPGAVPPLHSHDHCAVVAARRDDARITQPSVVLITRADADQRPGAVEAALAPALRPLDVAPKASPPV